MKKIRSINDLRKLADRKSHIVTFRDVLVITFTRKEPLNELDS